VSHITKPHSVTHEISIYILTIAYSSVNHCC